MDDKTEISQGKPKLGNEPDGRTVADVTPAGTDQRSIALPGETVPAAPEPEALRAIEDAVAAEWNEGDILLDLYEVLGVLGEGGMGKVYRIRHRAWNLDLAVKSPRPETIAQAGGKENFIREAETWVNLGLHPHTVSCYYVRTLGGIPRVFAELVEGGSLADWIRTRKLYEGGPEKALERILDIAIQFAWGLQHAHEHGLIHQDVKPANVMMTPDGTAKVTDFGLAKARGLVRERSEVIAGGSVLVSAGGMTPAYCSPEQAARQPLSRKTDIWSWGVSVLEMFTGEVTWLAGQAAAQALQSYREAETGEAALPRMPEAIAALLTKCFALDPLARPKDMHQVVEELQGIYRACMGTDYARPAPRAADLLADGLNNRGVSLLDLGRKEEAEKAFDRALQADAHHLEASYNRGLLLWRSGRMTDDVLVKQLEEVRTTHTGDWRDEYLLGLVHMERGDGKSAVTILEAASRQAPQEAEIHGALEVACSSQEEWHSWVRTFEGHADSVLSVSICPDGRWVLSGSEDKTLRLWELATGQCVRIFKGHTGWVISVNISPDARWALSGSHDRTLRLWELATGNCVRTFEGHASPVTSVTFGPDGRWALSGSWDDTLRLWELATGRCVRTLEGHTSDVSSVALGPDGRWALSGSVDHTLRLWELKRCGPPASLAVACPRSSAEAVRAETEVRQALENAESALRQGDPSSAAVEVSRARRISGYERHKELLELWCQIRLRGKLKCFSGAWGIRTFEGHTNMVTSVSISPDGRWALSGSWDNTLRLWELATGRCICTFEGHTNMVTSISISPDGRWALSGSWDNTLRLWELATGRCVRTFVGHADWVTSVSISPDGRWGLSGCGRKLEQSKDSTPRLWELATGRCVRTFEGHSEAVNSVSISPDGRWGLTGSSDFTLCLWGLATGQCICTFEGHTNMVTSVSISPDGRWALSGSWDNTLRLWELATGRCVRTFEGHTGPVNSVSISPDGCWALSGGHDKTVRLWELATGQCVRTFEGHANWVDSVSISPDGRWALSGSSDNTLRLWEFDWECEFTPPVDWNEGARPHLENFLSLHTPYEAILPRDRKPSEEEVQQVLTRRGAPSWTEDDFKDLLNRLCFAGYGWLRPQGIRQKLEEMATTWTVSPHEPKHGVPASLGAPAETVKKNAASSRIGALAAVLQAQEESAGLKQTPRPSPLPTMAATPPAREGGREQIDGQQALLLEKIVEQLEARGQPGIAQQLRAGSLGKPKSQPAPTPRLLPQKKAAAQSARGRKTRGIPRRLPNAALTFKLAWLAGWLVLILDQIAGKSLGLHLLPASEFRTPIDRCWDAGALGVAAILLLMIAPFVIERVAAGRKGR